MKNLVKFKLLILIVLLNSSINLYASSWHIPSTGELKQKDSVLVSSDDLRIANSKLVELKYEKAVNEILKTIVQNDSLIIDELIIDNTTLNAEVQKLTQSNKKYKKQRNIGIGTSATSILSIILMIII